MPAPPEARLTAEEYLAIERASETKYEFYRGEMFATAGARHSRTCLNVARLLDALLPSKACYGHCRQANFLSSS